MTQTKGNTMEEKIEEIIYEFRIGRNMENPSKRLLTLFQETIEQAMPERKSYHKPWFIGKKIYEKHEVPMAVGYNEAIDKVKSNLLNAIGK